MIVEGSGSLKEGNKARRRACGRACVHACASVRVLLSCTCCLCIRACLHEHAGTRAWVRTYVSLLACVQVRLHVRVACASSRAWKIAHARSSRHVCAITQACVPVCAPARACLRACTYVLPASTWVNAPTRAWVAVGTCVRAPARKCVSECTCVLPARACMRTRLRRAYASLRACILPARAWIHVRMCASTRACTYASVHVCAPAGTSVRERLCVSTCLRVCASMSVWACIPACARMFACACVRMPTRTSVRVRPAPTQTSGREHLRELMCMCACLSVRACCLRERESLRIRVCAVACGCVPACPRFRMRACMAVRARLYVCACFRVRARLLFHDILGWKQRYNSVWTCEIEGIIPWKRVNTRRHGFTLIHWRIYPLLAI